MPRWRRRGGGAAAEGGASLPGGAAGPECPPGSCSVPASLPASSCSHRLTSRTPALRACSCRGPWRRSWRRRRRSGPRTDSCGEPARWRWVSRPGPARTGHAGLAGGRGPALRHMSPPAGVPAGCERSSRDLGAEGEFSLQYRTCKYEGEGPKYLFY